MNETDHIRAALSAAVQMPGDVSARTGAAEVIRRRARSRRRTAVGSFLLAVPACVAVVVLLVSILGSGGASTLTPARTGTPHTSAAPSPGISVGPGPRTLATPIEFRPVLRADVACETLGSVPEVGAATCLQLGPAAMVVHRVQDLSVQPAQATTGVAGDGAYLMFTMTSHDRAAFSTLTAQLLHKQIAFVVNGVVQNAPTIAAHITAGAFQIVLDGPAASALLADLTG